MCQGVTQQQSLVELHKLRLMIEYELLCGGDPDEQRLAALRESVDWVCHRLSSELGLKQVTPQTIAATVPLLHDEDAAIRQHAASTLSILASRSVFNQFRIGSEPGVISGLVQLLQDAETWVRGSAAAALSHLAMHCYSTMQTRICQEPGAVEALVCLLHDRDAGLGCAAALALKTLAENHPKNQTLIGQTPGAISGLVALLYTGDAALQTMAHVALKRLAANHPVNRARVRHEALSYDGQWQLEL